jgi:hypothetical protein
MLLTGQQRKDAQNTIIKYHYTHSIHRGKTHYFKYKNAILSYSIPANNNISTYLLGTKGIVWELSRMYAPNNHEPNLLTKAISLTIKELKKMYPKLDAVISYADPNEGHSGHIYKAASWLYLGQSQETRMYMDNHGNIKSRRSFHSMSKQYTKQEIKDMGYTQVKREGKHRYARAISKRAKKALRNHKDLRGKN